MQIRKTYQSISPQILYDEIKELVQKQGALVDQEKLETYSMPGDSSSFIYRGTMNFKIQNKACLNVHVIGSDKTETKLMLDVNDSLFPADKVAALQDDLIFMLGSYEPKS
jgi:hypothetical protein